MDTNEIREAFKGRFLSEPLIVGAPGRMNIIGEHTDYNMGFVLPASINKLCQLAISENGKPEINIVAYDLEEEFSFNLDKEDLKPVKNKTWVNYFLGILSGMQERGVTLRGIDVLFSSDVPQGGGLSSSAAIEVAFGFALNKLWEQSFTRVEIAEIGQKAEHEFVGVKCGIMDQYASCLGKKDSALLIDCQTLKHELIDAKMPGYSWLLFDTNISHNLAGSEYNIRRQQCEEGVKIISTSYPNVQSLRDVNSAMLKEKQGEMDSTVFKRCQYVIQENQRVHLAVECLRNGNINELGELLYASHKGLSEDYEVSCEELDILVEFAKENQYIKGARMMGGGFGGCTLNLVPTEKVSEIINEITEKYHLKTKKQTSPYSLSIEDGAKILYA